MFEVLACSVVQNHITGDDFVSFVIRLCTNASVHVTEILVAAVEQLLKAVDDEICLLEVIDDVFRAHDSFEIERDAIG